MRFFIRSILSFSFLLSFPLGAAESSEYEGKGKGKEEEEKNTDFCMYDEFDPINNRQLYRIFSTENPSSEITTLTEDEFYKLVDTIENLYPSIHVIIETREGASSSSPSEPNSDRILNSSAHDIEFCIMFMRGKLDHLDEQEIGDYEEEQAALQLYMLGQDRNPGMDSQQDSEEEPRTPENTLLEEDLQRTPENQSTQLLLPRPLRRAHLVGGRQQDNDQSLEQAQQELNEAMRNTLPRLTHRRGPSHISNSHRSGPTLGVEPQIVKQSSSQGRRRRVLFLDGREETPLQRTTRNITYSRLLQALLLHTTNFSPMRRDT